MSDYLDVCQFKQTQNGKWRFIRLGSGKQNDKGGWDIYLDALPIPDEKGCRLSMQPRREQGEYQQDKPGLGAAPGAFRDVGMDDEVPF